MPVLIFASHSEIDIVRPLAETLRADGGEVRCYLDEDDFDLREMGCKLAIGDLTDDMNLEAALTNTHTFIPLLPDPAGTSSGDDLERIRQIGRAAADSVRSSSIVQTIVPVPSVLRSASPLGDVYKEFVEGLSGIEPKAIFEVGLLWGENRPFPQVVTALEAEVRLSVLSVGDLVALIAAADECEGLNGSWELGGETLSTADLKQFGEVAGSAATPLLEEALKRDLLLGNSALELLNLELSSITPVRSL